MVSMTILAALAATTTVVQGHFTFVRIAHNGIWQHPTRYIRNKTAPFNETWFNQPGLGPYHGYNFPTEYVNLPESVRCGRDNMAHAADTEVLRVAAGDEIEFAHQRYEPEEWTDDMFYGCPEGRGTCHKYGMDINHPGPVMAFLSPVPKGVDVREYGGAGEWTKIYTLGFRYRKNETLKVDWLAYNWEKTPVPRFAFKIPPQTPSGQYLLRMDLIWAYSLAGGAQMYPSCAHIDVSGISTGQLPAGVQIPEIFSPDSPGMTLSWEMGNQYSVDANYSHPGGPLWDGEKLVPDKPVIGE
ncbi:lytic polysaccharide monooxygenase [Lentithecium fluviatile CBS 122367]|uniref:lytic cellulose monooxygenase (C4-dehydrogenating) n=1 Tax=Lentithecium fluviatile CBS 122367 TaxID=1168545 RepID=A0A6G1JLP5_9PLEO|nr:lytic polysaccharide monooxygenase [Lentithecium fluviatile CBS 122367]